ncbi:OmpA-OmpF porin, OOP family [Duganella sacchari]|uniref:OmpA-OmpF porin, OOP family n=1 Tax=Duganella sacchari TaxID=551987 RepID=A0A1M7QIL5_9BURK|nr:OmpA family protein [Duganella sacchari]SHN30976.1 OmpA-OmpF porin, OOP family [Duganella sacchari]
MNKSKKIALAAAALCASFSVMAQDAVINPSWYIQPSVNGIKPDSDFGVDKRGYGAGLKFGKAVNENWDVQMGYTYARSRENGQRYQQDTLGVDGLYLFSRKSFRPFILVGVGAERDKANLNAFGERKKTSPYLSAGLGFQADMSDRVTFQADLRDVHGFIRGDNFPNSKSNNYYLTVGLNIAFDAPPRPAPPAPPPAPVVAEPPPPPPAPLPPPPPAPARFEKVTMSATKMFEFDSAKLTADTPKLDEIAAALNANPSVDNVVITGYTDRLGSDKYNQKLSERRANAVKDYLVSKGIAANRLVAEGKGKANPVVQCNNKKRADLIACLEPNRRVEVEQITIERRVP